MSEIINQDIHIVGKFNLDGKEISGEIVFNKSNGIIILNVVNKVETLGKDYSKLPAIVGETNTGSVVTLYDNYCIKNYRRVFQYQNIQYRSRYMTCGITNTIDRKFNKLVCIIENGLHWSGLSQINDNCFDEIKFIKKNDVIWEWLGATIKFSTNLSNELLNFPRKEVYEIKERLLIEIEAEQSSDIEYFIKIRDNILALISFGIQDNINIEKQYLYDYNCFYCDKQLNKQDYYKFELFTTEPYRKILNTNYFDYNFTLSQLNNFNELSEKIYKLIPVFNLYSALYKYNDMPVEMVFLNIVQALETFHSRFFHDNKKEKYMKSVEDRFSHQKNYNEIEKLLLSDGQMNEKLDFIILVSRINELLIGKNDGLFSEFYMPQGIVPDFGQKVADTRNYYTHYDKSKENKRLCGQALQDAIYILKLLLEYSVCSELNIDIRNKICQKLNYFLTRFTRV